MKGMLIKDLCLLKGQKSFFLILCVMVCFFLGVTDQYEFGIGYLIVMMGMIALTTINYDEYDNGNSFLFTLPISRKGYVREKYIFYMLATVLAWVIAMLAGIAVIMIKGRGREELMITVFVSAATLGVGMLMGGLALPLQLKFGSDKRQIAMIAAFGIIFFSGYFGTKIIEASGLEVIELLEMLGKFSLTGWIVIGIAIVLGLYFISYLVSVRIMEKREL